MNKHWNFLVDRDCVLLDGECDCPFETVDGFRRPFCKRYNKDKADEANQALRDM